MNYDFVSYITKELVMNSKKKFLSLSLALVTCIGTLLYAMAPAFNWKAEAINIEDSFNLDDNSETVIKFRTDISKAILTLSDTSFVHTGEEIRPTVSVRRTANAVRDLREGTEYTVSYENNIEPGTATLSVTGIGKYKGTASTTFQITHDYSIVNVIKPTYKEQGYTLHKCSVCGAEYKDNFVDKLEMVVKYQLKDLNDGTYGIRTILIVDEEYVVQSDSASVYLTIPGQGDSDKINITKAYRSLIASGKTVSPGNGNVFLIGKFMDIPEDLINGITVHFECDGVETERTI